MITLDFTQSQCPIPLVQTKLHVRQANGGDQFYLLLSDQGSLVDVPKLLKKMGHQVVLLDISDDNKHTFQVSITPN